MMDDFVNAIAYEVKLEIANRYFGFRSQIQAEIGQYLEGLHRTEKEHLPLIRLDIRRMGILLHRQAFLEQFLRMTGLSERIAENGFDRQSLSNADELFTGLAGEGFSRWRRYRDLAFKVYRSLQNHIGAYRNARLDLDDEYGEICTRIDNFHRNNDLSGILSFLRTFDSSDNERLKFLHSDSSLQDRSLDQDLRIPHPRQVSDALPDLAELPPLNQVKNPLNDLLKSAYSLHNGRDTAFPW